MPSMSAAEIIEELPRLSPDELMLVHERILELEDSYVIDPSPEFDAAIEEGLQSIKSEPALTLEEARSQLAVWRAQSA
jgi:hypothetical protein